MVLAKGPVHLMKFATSKKMALQRASLKVRNVCFHAKRTSVRIWCTSDCIWDGKYNLIKMHHTCLAILSSNRYMKCIFSFQNGYNIWFTAGWR